MPIMLTVVIAVAAAAAAGDGEDVNKESSSGGIRSSNRHDVVTTTRTNNGDCRCDMNARGGVGLACCHKYVALHVGGCTKCLKSLAAVPQTD